MTLKIHSNKQIQVVKLDKSFFSTHEEFRNGKSMGKVTPKQKAEQMGRQVFGSSYTGHVLEMDGKVIHNTLERNKEPERLLNTPASGVRTDTKGQSVSTPVANHLPYRFGKALKG